MTTSDKSRLVAQYKIKIMAVVGLTGILLPAIINSVPWLFESISVVSVNYVCNPSGKKTQFCDNCDGYFIRGRNSIESDYGFQGIGERQDSQE